MSQIVLEETHVEIPVSLDIHSMAIDLTIANISQKESPVVANLDHISFPHIFFLAKITLNQPIILFSPTFKRPLPKYTRRLREEKLAPESLKTLLCLL